MFWVAYIIRARSDCSFLFLILIGLFLKSLYCWSKKLLADLGCLRYERRHDLLVVISARSWHSIILLHHFSLDLSVYSLGFGLLCSRISAARFLDLLFRWTLPTSSRLAHRLHPQLLPAPKILLRSQPRHQRLKRTGSSNIWGHWHQGSIILVPSKIIILTGARSLSSLLHDTLYHSWCVLLPPPRGDTLDVSADMRLGTLDIIVPRPYLIILKPRKPDGARALPHQLPVLVLVVAESVAVAWDWWWVHHCGWDISRLLIARQSRIVFSFLFLRCMKS